MLYTSDSVRSLYNYIKLRVLYFMCSRNKQIDKFYKRFDVFVSNLVTVNRTTAKFGIYFEHEEMLYLKFLDVLLLLILLLLLANKSYLRFIPVNPWDVYEIRNLKYTTIISFGNIQI
jgi:hypothetical protein